MTTNRVRPVLVLLFWVAILPAAPAVAQTAMPTREQPAPWEHNVSQETWQKAELLLQEANGFLESSNFVAAEEKYRAALEVWDHPVTHYNFAQLLFRQGKLLDVHEHITKAMIYGEAAIGKDRLSRAETLKASVEKQLGRVDVTCDIPEASVWLDGNRVLTCPGNAEVFVVPGLHTVSTRREGYPHNDRRRTLAGGQVVPVHISQLYGEEDLHISTTRWSWWKPWALVGAGLAAAGGGGILHSQARGIYRGFDKHVAQCGSAGCAPNPRLTQEVRRGDRLQGFAMGSYALGGAAAVTGALLVFLNRDQFITRTPDELDGVNLSLSAGKGESAFLATWRF